MLNRDCFRVLLLDDDKQVCDRVKKRIEGPKRLGQLDPVLPVEVSAVALRVQELERGQWSFDPAIVSELSKACTEPPDLIFIDFGYADASVINAFKKEAETREITAEELQGKVLTPLDLSDWIRSSSAIPEPTRRLLVKNLIECGKIVYLYSYASKEFLRALGEVNERQKKTAKAFSKSTVVAIDTREELYHSSEFDWPNPSKRDSNFYAYQISVLLDYIVHKEILRTQHSIARYLRVKRTAMSASILTAIGAAIGFGSQWIGSLVTDLYKNGNIFQATAVGLSLVLALFVLGFLSPLLFDRLMTNLVENANQNRE